VTNGRINRLLGWLLLTLTFAASGVLDAYSLSIRDTDTLRASPALLARHAQAVALGMAFFQLLVGLLLSRRESDKANARLTAALSMAGSLLYVAGYALHVFWPHGALVAVVGAALNAVAIALLLPARFPASLSGAARTAVVVLCGGMLLDLAMALASADVGLPLPQWANDPESVQLRMLRLARAAMIALPLLALLYAEARERARPVGKLLEWAGVAGTFGAATMSLTLVLAACVWMPFKYLLGLPADAAVLGVVAGAWLAYKRVVPFELIAWLLVLLSMSAGLFMGLYAFDGPMPDPEFLGAYNEYGRRMSRLVHAYAIVYGLTLLNLQRDLPATEPPWGRLLIVAGTLWSVLAAWLMASGAVDAPHVPVAVGTLAVGLGLAACLPSLFRRPARDGSSDSGA
jgi:hypothetical protein